METTTAPAETAIAASAQPQAYNPALKYCGEQVVQLVAALEEPFDPREIKWRVTNTTQTAPWPGHCVRGPTRIHGSIEYALHSSRLDTRVFDTGDSEFRAHGARKRRCAHLGENRRRLPS